jgi:UDP-2-acetamido-2,6-beta-L-arabino-hexul-4-ose reductase
MRVLVTGANGFVGKNLLVRLSEIAGIEALSFTRDDGDAALAGLVAKADFVVHLAGVNRPKSEGEFKTGNADLTQRLCAALQADGRAVPIAYASSTQALADNPYGRSKLEAENLIKAYAARSGAAAYVYRLPNVFGKWCRPNYNSAIATFCHNIARGQPIQINDRAASLTLVYIDDVVAEFVRLIQERPPVADNPRIPVEYSATVGELADMLGQFRASRQTLVTERVGSGLCRALYATYISYLEPEAFSYDLPKYEDPRGAFVEMLKTHDSGQFSFFRAPPGVTRGGHYHHSKSEKFLVVQGRAKFRFRHLVSNQIVELHTEGRSPQVVETIPGWSHDISNVGDEDMIVLLWANEIFDRQRPDTVSAVVVP